jgi:[CysO sulfur-carrier protein]-S-L-cysteine hydrolase
MPDPSTRDHETMWAIVEDPEVGANFAVLLIIRLDKAGHLQGTVTIYLPEHQTLRAELIQERTMI